MTALDRLRAALRRRATYVATKRELQSMPLDVALDLGIDRTKAADLAYDAVYGAPQTQPTATALTPRSA